MHEEEEIELNQSLAFYFGGLLGGRRRLPHSIVLLMSLLYAEYVDLLLEEMDLGERIEERDRRMGEHDFTEVE